MQNHPPSSPLREWTVAAGIVRNGDSVLMVRNRRKNGTCDWSTPGGVVEPGEALLEALSREVREETGLNVTNWAGPVYTVVAVAPAMGWHLTVEVYRSDAFTGTIEIDDPDKIVEEAVFLAPQEAVATLAGHSQWVAEPITDWLTEPWDGHRQYGYELSGVDRATLSVQRHQ